MKFKNLIVATLAMGLNNSVMSSAHASVIAIIDSGTDLNHQELKNKKWVNTRDPDDAVDNDNNGYIDDVNGWNFAENNNQLFDKRLLGSFSPDAYRYFEIQTKMMTGEATEGEVSWLRMRLQDPKFLAELGVFGNFIHGTHVAGISAKLSEQAKIMGLKIIPTKAPTVGGGRESAYFGISANGGVTDAIIKGGLRLLASQQGKQLESIGKYVAAKKARLANCSFGTSTAAAKKILGPILRGLLRREPTAQELEGYSIYFVNEVVKAAGTLVNPSKSTLFVIAAGNDGMNNDQFPTSPANIKQDNTITVAATNGYKKIANFSNYGARMVEVAAPGVGILSAIPGNQYVTVSGTSQAAPFVTGVAGMMLDLNPALSHSDVKRILMGTSDQKDFLRGVVMSGGIVNAGRAALAARLAKTLDVTRAIESARMQVTDVRSAYYESDGMKSEGYVIPMPGLFN